MKLNIEKWKLEIYLVFEEFPLGFDQGLLENCPSLLLWRTLERRMREGEALGREAEKKKKNMNFANFQNILLTNFCALIALRVG